VVFVEGMVERATDTSSITERPTRILGAEAPPLSSTAGFSSEDFGDQRILLLNYLVGRSNG